MVGACWYLAGSTVTLVGTFVAASTLFPGTAPEAFAEFLAIVWLPSVLGLALLALCSLYPLAGAVVGICGGLLLVAAYVYEPLSAPIARLWSEAELVGVGVALAGFGSGLLGIIRNWT
jgi:hypothetical protein